MKVDENQDKYYLNKYIKGSREGFVIEVPQDLVDDSISSLKPM